MRTADGVTITHGLRVIDNDMEVGTVDLEYREPYAETHWRTGHVEHWFYVKRDKNGWHHLTSESRVSTYNPVTGRKVV